MRRTVQHHVDTVPLQLVARRRPRRRRRRRRAGRGGRGGRRGNTAPLRVVPTVASAEAGGRRAAERLVVAAPAVALRVALVAARRARACAAGESPVTLPASPSTSLLKHLLKGEGRVQQNDSLADGCARAVGRRGRRVRPRRRRRRWGWSAAAAPLGVVSRVALKQPAPGPPTHTVMRTAAHTCRSTRTCNTTQEVAWLGQSTHRTLRRGEWGLTGPRQLASVSQPGFVLQCPQWHSASHAYPQAVHVPSRRRDCHFAGIPSTSILKHLLKGEGGVQENDSLADGYTCRWRGVARAGPVLVGMV